MNCIDDNVISRKSIKWNLNGCISTTLSDMLLACLSFTSTIIKGI